MGTESEAQFNAQQLANANAVRCSTPNPTPFANLLNETRDIGSSLINATEQVMGAVISGFNAMQDDGILSEANYNYYPQSPSLKSGILADLAAGNAPDATTVITTQAPESGGAISSQTENEVNTLDNNLQQLITDATNERNQQISSGN
jgi:hypothetical protein